jgi:hypothetical protein
MNTKSNFEFARIANKKLEFFDYLSFTKGNCYSYIFRKLGVISSYLQVWKILRENLKLFKKISVVTNKGKTSF